MLRERENELRGEWQSSDRLIGRVVLVILGMNPV
jgi:hypothetical protein